MVLSTIKKGSKGTDVIVLQALLRALQYYGKDSLPIKLNGVCDDNLVFAINTFQNTQRIYGYECGTNGTNDGCFGEKCWKALLGENYG